MNDITSQNLTELGIYNLEYIAYDSVGLTSTISKIIKDSITAFLNNLSM